MLKRRRVGEGREGQVKIDCSKVSEPFFTATREKERYNMFVFSG